MHDRTLEAALPEEARRQGTPTAQRLERFLPLVATEVERAGPMHRDLVVTAVRLVHVDWTEGTQSRRLYAAFGALLRDGVRAGYLARATVMAPFLADALGVRQG